MKAVFGEEYTQSNYQFGKPLRLDEKEQMKRFVEHSGDARQWLIEDLTTWLKAEES
jgi:hypothetical protein